MKWIGQHIWDFVSRFRSDVYLEAVESGTIASGGNLGLDSNNKIVKADTESGELSFDGSTANGILTYGSATEIDVEDKLTWNPSTGKLTAEANIGPYLELVNINNDILGGTVTLKNQRGTSVTTNTDGDELGRIQWVGTDSQPGTTTFARIVGKVGDNTNTEEAGILSLEVAEYDGTLTSGLLLDGDTDADGVINVNIAAGATSTTTIAGDLTTNGESVLFTSSTSQKPVVEIRNTTSDGDGPELKFNNTNAGGDASDGDFAGKITFNAMDDGTPTETTYASIYSRIDDATNTEESGNLYLSVANHDGGLGVGFKLTGGSANDEVDVEIGKGGSSVTNVVGDLTIAGRTRRTLKITDGSAAGEYDGDVVYTGSTTLMTAGDLYYYNSSGTWTKANASTEAETKGLLAIALGAESDTHGMLLRGMVTTGAVAGTPDEGAILYVRASAGDITTTAPSSSGQCVRIIGYCMENSNNRIWFDPDKTWIELA